METEEQYYLGQHTGQKIDEAVSFALAFKGDMKLVSYDEYRNIQAKEWKYYFVARDATKRDKGKIWRVYLRTKPIFEFDDNDNISCVFPLVFPFVFSTSK